MGDRKNQYNDLEKLLVPTVENLGQIKNEVKTTLIYNWLANI